MRLSGKIITTISAAAILAMFVVPTMASSTVQENFLVDNDPGIMTDDMLLLVSNGYGEQNHENEQSNEQDQDHGDDDSDDDDSNDDDSSDDDSSDDSLSSNGNRSGDQDGEPDRNRDDSCLT